MRYTLMASKPEAHLFGVALEIDRPDPAGQRLTLPAWTPGSYMVRDFARHVIELHASCGGELLAVEKIDKQTWRCSPCDGPLHVEWRVYAKDASVRAAVLDDEGGFCNGSSVFLQPLNVDDGPFELEIFAPGREGWRASTAMSAVEVDANGFGRYRAEDYEELIDHPVRLGHFSRYGFEVRGVPHELVVSGNPRFDHERLCRDLARACDSHVELFGELPVSHYIFFMNIVGSGYGGLEHRASTLLDVARASLPQAGDDERREDYQELLGLCSHEYFHLWHVKRIRPAAFVPYDLTEERYTTLLWAFEGMTSYYDDLGLLRAGLLPRDAWLERMARTITRVHRGPGRLRQSVAESSFDAWTRFYKQDENAPNAIVSYYAKGALIAMALDLTLRADTGGDCSLDDLMRALWHRHGRPGIGVDEDGIERLAAEISGLDLDDFFAHALRSTVDLDLAGLLANFGIDLEWAPATAAAGFVPRMAAHVREDSGLPRIVRLIEDGAAQRAGLAVGDRLVAIDGVHLPGGSFGERVDRLPAAQPLDAHVLRDDRLLVRQLVLDKPARDQCRLQWQDDCDHAVANRRADWLGEAP